MAIDFQDWDGGERVQLSMEAHELPTVVPAKWTPPRCCCRGLSTVNYKGTPQDYRHILIRKF
ncbi:hypothetical protein KC19_4G112700 [Ceratodon purpureus]|uniref:Uncharacterized protein n=1 Tax=Ceratodon purpureus TaxID=3225 RepID=A0A8T0I7Z5_CERPU|nr:hypothetical protein KC19_4G112700 [Ceratodon purpureus]